MTAKRAGLPAAELPPRHVSRQTFDIAGLFREKNPALARRVPSGLMRLLERLLHQDTINRELHGMRELPCRHFPAAVLAHVGIDYSTRDEPRSWPGRAPVFMANHPLGAHDGLVMLDWLLGRFDDVRLPVNDILARFPHLQPFVVPVDKYRTRRELSAALREVFDSDAALLVFPAGATARPAGGRLVDRPWQKMAVRLARETGRPVVPVWIEARNSRHFYAIYRIRRLFGIGANLEMFLLADEMLRPACRHIELRFGQPVAPAELRRFGTDDHRRTLAVRRRCEALGGFHA